MTNLSDLFPAGAGKQVSFVADGTLTNGQVIALKTDGTVEAVTNGGNTAGSDAQFEGASVYGVVSAYDSTSGKIVVVYSDVGNSFHGTVAIGTVSGTSISFGTPVVFYTDTTDWPAVSYDVNADRVVISWQAGGAANYGYAIVGTVSGTSISFGTGVEFNAASTQFNVISYDANAQKVLLTYHGTSSYGYSIVGTVSGTSISFGTAVVFNSAYTSNPASVYDSNAQKVVIGYGNSGSSGAGTAIVATISGTSVSYGTPTEFQPGASNAYISLAFDSVNNKIAVIYEDTASTNYGHGIVGTVSGTSISFGASVVFSAATTTFISATYNVAAASILIFFRDTPLNGTIVSASISGTAISFGTETIIVSGSTEYNSTAYDVTNGKVVVTYKNSTSSTGVGNVITSIASNMASIIGLTDAAISDTASGNITVKGGIATKGLTSLTPGTDYYVQGDGTISAVTTSPAVKLGRALSATSIDLEYQS